MLINLCKYDIITKSNLYGLGLKKLNKFLKYYITFFLIYHIVDFFCQ